jgi:hypothetical protein
MVPNTLPLPSLSTWHPFSYRKTPTHSFRHSSYKQGGYSLIIYECADGAGADSKTLLVIMTTILDKEE